MGDPFNLSEISHSCSFAQGLLDGLKQGGSGMALIPTSLLQSLETA